MRLNSIIFYFIPLILLYSCSEDTSFSELLKFDSEKPEKEYSSEQLGFQMSLYENLTLSDAEYLEEYSLETFYDTVVVGKSLFKAIAIMKFQGSNSSLKSEWDKFQKKRQFPSDGVIKSSGKTNFLNKEALYEYDYIPNSTEQEFDVITFLIQGDNDEYFLIVLTCTRMEKYPDDLKELLQCAKSFQLLD